MSSFHPSEALVEGAFEDFFDALAEGAAFGGSSLMSAMTSFIGIFPSGMNSTRGRVSNPIQFH